MHAEKNMRFFIAPSNWLHVLRMRSAGFVSLPLEAADRAHVLRSG